MVSLNSVKCLHKCTYRSLASADVSFSARTSVWCLCSCAVVKLTAVNTRLTELRDQELHKPAFSQAISKVAERLQIQVTAKSRPVI